MATTIITEQMDQLHSEIIIKEEQNEFNSDAEEEEWFYKESHNISCGSNIELSRIKDEKSSDGQNTLNDNKNNVGECNNTSTHITNMSENKDASCTQVVKEEFQNEKEEASCESEINQIIIKCNINDGLHSELIIKEEDLSSSDGISTDNEDKNDLDFCQKQDLKVHTGEKSFKCDKCEKSFSRKHVLLRHTFTHTGERRFKCDKCEKSFSRKHCLTLHTFTHTGEKPFKCDKCEETFSTKYTLRLHTFIHTGGIPFKCDKCGKTYSTKQALTSHTFIHVGKRPFKCDKCEKSFSQKQHLIHHNFAHNKETPFKCDKCKKTFSRKQVLLRHTFTHTREKS